MFFSLSIALLYNYYKMQNKDFQLQQYLKLFKRNAQYW